MDISIVIRNYNGRELMKSFLPSVIQSTKVYNGNCQIIVIDDGSTDDSIAFLDKHFPGIKVIRNWPNSGNTIDPVNIGVKESLYDIVVCLDTDVKVEEDFLMPLIKHFERSNVFAVAPKIISYRIKNGIESLTFPIFWRGRLRGFVPGMEGYSIEYNRSVPIFYAPGNAVAYRKSLFLSLKGEDTLFRPYYYEDIDICYRAWRRGFKTIYEPNSIVYHLSHATIKNIVDPYKTEIIRNKNALLFTWKNLMSPLLLVHHLFWLKLRLIKALVKKEKILFMALAMAIKQIPEVIKGRKNIKDARIKLSDRYLFNYFREVYHALSGVRYQCF
ncbi:MAG: glycosyltransferase family 2 protein [bacterium]